MGIPSSQTKDASSVASASSQESLLVRIRRKRRLVAGLGFLVLGGIAVGLRWTPAWQGYGKKSPQESARDHWEQALRASDEGDVDLAKSHLEAVLAICPLNVRAHFLMARTCRRTNDPAGRQFLFLAESLGWPQDQIVLEQRLHRAETGDIWSVEETLLDELNRLTPEEPVILEALLKGYMNSARFLDAVDIASTWIKRFPGDWLAYLDRGRAYQQLKRMEEAISDYQHVLKIRPDSMAATLWCADAFLAVRDYQSALEKYQAYREMAPADWETLLDIAECQFSLGQPQARATLENVLKDHPQDRGGLLLAARINIAEDAPEKALPYLRKALELGRPHPEVLQPLIRVLRKLNQHKEADQLEKRYDQILEKFERLRELTVKIQAEPGDASLRYQAGIVALESGHEKEAMSWFQTVFFVDPGHRPTHLALADYWIKHGQPQQAAYHLRRAEGKPR
jgi:tetratricopeptide (TPR) repeat protein